MTHYGLNPSFVYNSPLPLFGNLIRRAKKVEADGTIRLMEGARSPAVADVRVSGCTVTRGPGGQLVAENIASPDSASARVGSTGVFHTPSIAALSSLRPTVLRTLDWQKANLRTEWVGHPVGLFDTLQGTDRGMSVELQAMAANTLKCQLWWNAPPRYDLSVPEYEVRLTALLQQIRDRVSLPPILEYGNELWNAGFPVHAWLDGQGSWHTAAVAEIAILRRVADRVFGAAGPLGRRPYYLFVGGQLTVPSHLDKILSALRSLGVTPDLAGPALYVTPLKADKESWERTGYVPTQNELWDSCFRRLAEIALDDLPQHGRLCIQYSIPYFACYEAGQSLIAGARPWRRSAIEAQRTAWMGDLYREIRYQAQSAGVDLLNWYSAATDQEPSDPRVDVFGLLEGDASVPLLPKARAARGD
jgi:hypothetical protein